MIKAEGKSRITRTILERIPKEARVVRVKYEGPRIAIHTKNPEYMLNNNFIVADIVNTVKKRIVVRVDKSLRKDVDKAREMIMNAIPKDVEVSLIFFDKALGEVMVEVKDPKALLEAGFDPVKLTVDTGWKVIVKRAPQPGSSTMRMIYRSLNEDCEKRRKALEIIGETIFRERLFEGEEISLLSLGGFKQVGRSCMLVTTSESKILLDCGIHPGAKKPIDMYPRLDWANLNLDELDAVVISHAHLDHSGFLPFLFKYGYNGPVYCTEPTLPLTVLLLTDMIKIAQAEGREPPFDMRDVRELIRHCVTLPYNMVTDISPDVKLVLNNAGHILGSASIHLHIGEGKYNVIYTGDFKFGRTLLLKGANCNYIRAEALIIESTYGSRSDIMLSRKEAEGKLISTINQTLKEGGKVLIPVPAVGRAQEIMLVLDKYMSAGELVEVPVFMEGMLSEATAIHIAYPEYLSNEMRRRIVEGENPFASEYFTTVDHPSKREEALAEGPAIIMATSGMLEGGPVMEYLKHIAPDERNKIVFVSYQVSGTLGRRILDGTTQASTFDESGKIRIIEIKSKVERIEGFSGHSDYNQLISFVARLRPKVKRVIVNHGERRKAEELASSIGRLFRLPASAPSICEAIRLY